MASRDKKILVSLLATVYDKACVIFGQRYPEKSQPFMTCSGRTCAEQQILYDQPTDGKDNNGNGKVDESAEKVTWAKPGQSPHNYFPVQAFDISFITKFGKLDWSAENFKLFWEICQEVLKEMGQPNAMRWGGDWNGNGITSDEKKPDAPHYEINGWEKLVKNLQLYTGQTI